MDCNKTDHLLMKYLDNNLDKKEKEKLKKHLEQCPSCREDFRIYNNIIDEFNKIEIINVPENFEESVMSKINSIEGFYGEFDNRFDDIMLWFCSCSAFFAGFIVLFINNPESIINILIQNSELSSHYVFSLPVRESIHVLTSNMNQIMSVTFSMLGEYFEKLRYILICLLAVLGVVQYTVYRRNKLEV